MYSPSENHNRRATTNRVNQPLVKMSGYPYLIEQGFNAMRQRLWAIVSSQEGCIDFVQRLTTYLCVAVRWKESMVSTQTSCQALNKVDVPLLWENNSQKPLMRRIEALFNRV